ncbi:hypothetical protein MMC09_002004 [Bachmanniomyces sp. S44760]|nr:hypothetical protein [Bachmanniomyces sp. S44760]
MSSPTRTLPLQIIRASEQDAPRIADIHMSAFATNAMLLAQFPTPAVRAGLWTSLVKKAVAEIRDERWEVLLVAMGMEREREGEGEVEDGGVKGLGKREGEGERERGRGEIVAFAKWFCPRSRSKAIPRAIGIENGVDGTGEGEGYVKNEGEDEEQEYEEAPWVWPEGTDMEILEEWTRRVDAAGEVVMGRRPCYRLSFIATHPSHERLGAATALITWGLERSKRERIPVVLESTWNAVALYERLGFRAERVISMVLGGAGGGGGGVEGEGEGKVYEEICFVFWPDR